jgi:hypothetical protein
MNSSSITFKRPRSDDPFLVFDPSLPNAVSNYYRDIRDFTIPHDHLNLLEHLKYFALFLNTVIAQNKFIKRLMNEKEERWDIEIDYFQSIKERRDDNEDEDDDEEGDEMNEECELVDINVICSIAWEWHNNLRARKVTSFTSVYAIAYLMSWSGFCRMYYLKRLSSLSKEYLDKTAMDFEFTRMVSQRKFIVASVEPIMRYSLRELWNAIRLAISSLYTHSFSNEMKDYIYQLFIRYCALMTVSCTSKEDEHEMLDDSSFFKYNDSDSDDSGDDDDDDDDDNDEGDADEEEDFFHYKKKCIPVNSRYSMKSNYVYEGELIFYHQLSRLNLSTTIHLLHENKEKNRITLHGIDDDDNDNGSDTQAKLRFVEKCLISWSSFVSEISQNPHVFPSTKEIFRGLIMNIYLYHGERERYVRNCAESNNEAGDILNEFRPDDFNELQSLRKLVIQKIMETHHESFLGYLNGILLKTINQGSGNRNGDANIRINKQNGSLSSKVNTNGSNRSRLQMSNKTTSGTFGVPFSIYDSDDNNGSVRDTDIRANNTWIEDDENVPCLTYEKECILATKVSITEWFRYNRVECAKEIGDTFIIEELQDSMESIDNIFAKHKMYVLNQQKNGDHRGGRKRKIVKRIGNNPNETHKKEIPYIVSLMRIYYVIDINDIENVKIYKTKLFPKAFLTWLTLLVRYGFVKRKALHPTFIDLVNSMETIVH